MGEWETEDEYVAAAHAALPTPTDTPYRTPSGGSRNTSRNTSRRSSRRKSKSPDASSSPPRMPFHDRSRRESKDVANDESISILDPRRFTPTLHANLVSEILALRRDQEEKIKIIEGLETALHSSKGEQESLEATIQVTTKESRSLKRQLALLEGGTSSALTELAKERDEAVDNNAEIKKRLEAAQKKIRSQEENVDRIHELWGKDKDNWEEEKRKYERRIHVVEGRMKTVLEEVAAYQASHQNGPQPEHDAEDRENGAGQGSDTASVRTMSMTNSVRYSMLSGPNGYGGVKLNGVSLADELDLDADEEDMQSDVGGRESVLSLRHRRNLSRESGRDSAMSRTHRRNQSTESMMRPGSVARGKLFSNQVVLDRLEAGILEDDETPAPVKVEYVDTGIQYSPPPPEKISATDDIPPIEPLSGEPPADDSGKIEKQAGAEAPRDLEIEANQSRKRVYAKEPLVIDAAPKVSMKSAASQTLDDPLSPPRTPISPTRAPPPPPPQPPVIEVVPTRELISVSTQTDPPEPEVPPPSPKRAAPPPPIPIPSIQLHPPNSAPATPKEPLLPQQFKDAACQVAMQPSALMKSVSVQTEEIRVDQRIKQLPYHLQPSSISSKPPTPEPVIPEDGKTFSPVPGNIPPRNPRRVNSQHSIPEIPSSPPVLIETRDAYPGNNDDGPLYKGKGSTSIRRPHRTSSLFAGFDNGSSDEVDDFGEDDLSDNDFRTALSAAPRPKSGIHRPSKRISSPPTSVPEGVQLNDVSKPHAPATNIMKQMSNYEGRSDFSPPELPSNHKSSGKTAARQLDKPLTLVTKPNAMRRAALIQSGVAAHQSRPRSPSLPETVKEPPFPIPTRASSRKPPFSVSAPSDGKRSPSPWGGESSWGARSSSRGHYRRSSVRKVRSAAALPRTNSRYRRQGSRSPPPMSASTDAPESPQLPPMPSNEITTPRYMRDTVTYTYKSHRAQPSATTAYTANTSYTANTNYTANTTNTGATGFTGVESNGSNSATSVVDAIAQTMVGEWMFKYVRRRKSFGVETNGGDDANGVRHKRWVWLAPYERAVMWSSKQPTSGSALLGKTGRKLTIQSVLDVKDDTATPKGIPPLFNRSILILTPARALKFTAVSADRHYVWLTALSFLAHSSQAVPEIVSAPPPPQPVPDFELPRRVRRNGIRDSIRIAKGRTAASRGGPIGMDPFPPNGPEESIPESESFDMARSEPAPDIADPPYVPRFTDRGDRDRPGHYNPAPLGHGRKRSNTGPRVPPPLSFRGFSGPASSGHAATSSTAGLSVGTAGSSDIYQSQGSGSVAGGYTGMSMSGRSSIRTSEASSRPGAVVNNFFDAVGTVRMEAFISPMALSKFDDYPNELDEMDVLALRRRNSRERRRRSRNRDSYYSNKGRTSEDWYSGSKTAGEEEWHYDDPFRGF
ncbi:hypothetical protein B7463_g6450, partial [Scytalidium lignicola]